MENPKFLKRSPAALAIFSLLACSSPHPMAEANESETGDNPFKEGRVSQECQECSGGNCVNEIMECDLNAKCYEVANCLLFSETWDFEQCKEIAGGNEQFRGLIECVFEHCEAECEEVSAIFPK